MQDTFLNVAFTMKNKPAAKITFIFFWSVSLPGVITQMAKAEPFSWDFTRLV